MTHLLLAATVTPSEQILSSLGKPEGKQVRLSEAEVAGRGSLGYIWAFGVGVWGQEWGRAGLEAGLSWEVIRDEACFFTAMAKDILGEAGLHFDELNKLRVLDPEVTQQTTELKEECKDFVDKIGQFQKIVGGLIELVDQLAKEAENEKMKVRSTCLLSKSWPGTLVH
uniref:Intraflagellar transport 20 n=1 Tax=Rhinolophus ferrumequinum TaxID=59479 RepID=A0A671FHY8_RHIFE